MGTDAPTPPPDEPQTTDVAPPDVAVSVPPAEAVTIPGAPTDTAPPETAPETAPEPEAPELPPWAENETADPGVIRAIELGNAPERPEEVAPDTTLPEGNEAVVSAGKVLVAVNDPELGPQIGEWLERQAARDARLSPLVERLGYLPNVRLEFDADDPALARPAEPTPA